VGFRGEVSNSNFQLSKESDAMSDAIKNWLPITKRNRVALGFAFVALVIFVTWNFLPNVNSSEGIVAIELWSEVFSIYRYTDVFRNPNIEDFRIIAAFISIIFNGLVIVAIVPFWRIFHASNYIKLPIAILNLSGGLIMLSFVIEEISDRGNLYETCIFALIALSMLALSAALFIFKNELGIRHELEVKKTMGSE
jgi:hypothetical protein